MNTEIYARHTPFSDPLAEGAFLRLFPTDPVELARAVRNVVIHFRMVKDLSPARHAEADSRWMSLMLRRIREHAETPPTEARPESQRLVGCCRDYALTFVAALREHGVAARSRAGFAPYLDPGFSHDHVVAEHWNGKRWIQSDAQMPEGALAFDASDLPPGTFLSAAQVWRDLRAGRLDPQLYGVDRSVSAPLRGPDFILGNLLLEHAALTGHETLLWDRWGLGLKTYAELSPAELSLLDQLAETLLRDERAELEGLAQHPLLRVPDEVVSWPRTGGQTRVCLSGGPQLD